jgi:UDP-arabinose 4-epimerase
MKRNVLVTGGAGYIGSHTCKLLASAGYEPICFDNLSTGHKEFVKWGPLEEGDILDTPLLLKVLKKYQPVAVIHFAASAYVGESVTNPFKYYINNIKGTLSVLEAMKIAKIHKFVFSSTCATYGTPAVKLIDESCPQSPINPYGQSKLFIEKILYDLSNSNQISFVALRYFNAAGADKNGEIGEKHDPETHLIPLAINSSIPNGDSLQLFGTEFDTPDGSAVRDYIHVEDLASGHLLALEYLISAGESQYINLGTGNGTSVLQVLGSLNDLGIKVKYKASPKREGDPAYLVADATKAKIILGWEPKYKNIRDILITAVDWHKIQLALRS